MVATGHRRIFELLGFTYQGAFLDLVLELGLCRLIYTINVACELHAMRVPFLMASRTTSAFSRGFLGSASSVCQEGMGQNEPARIWTAGFRLWQPISQGNPFWTHFLSS